MIVEVSVVITVTAGELAECKWSTRRKALMRRLQQSMRTVIDGSIAHEEVADNAGEVLSLIENVEESAFIEWLVAYSTYYGSRYHRGTNKVVPELKSVPLLKHLDCLRAWMATMLRPGWATRTRSGGTATIIYKESEELDEYYLTLEVDADNCVIPEILRGEHRDFLRHASRWYSRALTNSSTHIYMLGVLERMRSQESEHRRDREEMVLYDLCLGDY